MNWLREIWKLRPPVSPLWMYRWLRDWDSRPSRWRAIRHTLPCWWALWQWAASPAGYDGDYTDVTFGAAPSPDPKEPRP